MPETPRPKRGFPWIKVGFLLGGIILVALILVPGLLNSSCASRHRNASTSLKTLASAEADFRANDRDWNRVNDYWVGDVSRLYFLPFEGKPMALIEWSVANADGAPRQPLPEGSAKAGYLYVAMKTDETGAPYDLGDGRNPSKFAFCAYPKAYVDSTWLHGELDQAHFTFIINEEGVMWRKDLHAAPALRWPKDLYAEGWSKLD
jgi:hypothetical protein